MACAVLVLLGVFTATGRGPLAGSEPSSPRGPGFFHGEEILGTRGHDLLYGSAAGDRLFAFGAVDHVNGGEGSDLIDAGNGADVVDAGPGDDRIRAFDGDRDVVRCGTGFDTAYVDSRDVTLDCEETLESADMSSPATPDPPLTDDARGDDAPSALLRGTIVLAEEPWICTGPVDLELVKVTMGSRASVLDAVSLSQNCSGRIGRIEVDTWSGDGIKVQNGDAAAHDLMVESGYVRCHSKSGGYHQDGIQVMGGQRITFRNLTVACGGVGVNAALFIARGGSDESTPTDVVLENGRLGPNAAHTILLANSVRSGARNTVICPGRFDAYSVRGIVVDPVRDGNVTADADDPRC